MNTVIPPRISISTDCEEELDEHLAVSRDNAHSNEDLYRFTQISRGPSLQDFAADAFAVLLQKAGTLDAVPSSSISTTSTARARSQSDSVTITPTWQQPAPRSLYASVKSFSDCRRSAPIPASILPRTPTKQSSSDTLDINHVSSTLAAPATPLTAVSSEELTPGLVQLRRAFPLPPSTAAGSIYYAEEHTQDVFRTPVISTSMQVDRRHVYPLSYRLPGAFGSFDSLETVLRASEDIVTSTPTAGQDRSGVAYPSKTVQDTPRTPPEHLHHRHSSSTSSSLKPSPESVTSKSSPAKHSKRALRSRRSKASFKSTEGGNDDGIYDPSSGYDFRTCPGSPSTGQQTQRPALGPRSASRSSWRSRYSRPDTAMSIATTTETVYEDAADHFSGDEADAEEDAHELLSKSVLASRLAISTTSSTSSISTVRGYERPLGRFRLSFQRRRAESPLYSNTTFRPSSSLSNQSRDSSSHPQAKRTSAAILAQQQRRCSLTPRSSPEDRHFPSNAIPEKEGDEAQTYHALSSAAHRRLSRGAQGHTRDSSSSNSHDTHYKERPTSAMSALRPLMLTPEKTRRGSLKDWSVQTPHGSHFIEDFEQAPVEYHSHHHQNTELAALLPTVSDGQTAKENPYAQIYEELAKSPELEYDRTLSPTSPGLSDVYEDAASIDKAFSVLHVLDPVAEESFIGTDQELQSTNGERSKMTIDQEESMTVEKVEETPNNSNISISVVALTTDSPQPVSAGRQSTESRSKRTSRPPSISAAVIGSSSRTRTASVASSAVSRSVTVASTTTNTNATLNMVQNATVEYGQRLPRQMGRMETKSPRSEGGFDRGLVDFFHGPRLPELDKQVLHDNNWNGSMMPAHIRHSQDDGRKGNQPLEKPARQRTKSQPAKLRSSKPPSTKHVTPEADLQRHEELIKELLPLHVSLRKQVKVANRKGAKESSAPAGGGSSTTNLTSILLGALKKRKSAGQINIADLTLYGETLVPPLPLSVKDMTISAPLQARHICTGALNPNDNRESPFGRRPSSPVQGYIDVPFAGAEFNHSSQEGVIHPDFLDFDIRTDSNMGSPAENSNSSHSWPAQSRSIEAYSSPAFFSSPLSSTSSHSEEGPSTPRALSPSVVCSNGPTDFWAVSFAEAQAGDSDFVAPHATLVKSNKLAMLSTNEKARRRASKLL